MSINLCRVALRSVNGGYNAVLTPVVSVGSATKLAVPNRQRIRQCQHQQTRTFLSWLIPTQLKVNRMLEKCNERSKIIVVDGNIASGKSTVAKQLADALGMLHMPEADVQYVPKRKLGHPVEDKYIGDVSLEKFYADPFSKDYHAFNFQYMMYVSRYFQMCDAMKHVFHTGQGVVMERSVFSDFVFMQAEHKIGCYARDRVKLYDELVSYSLHKLVPPHVAVYLDVPVDHALEGIKKRGIAMEQKITGAYLQHIADAYKEKYLPSIMDDSIVLDYDWTNPLNNVDRILEDIDLVSEEDWKYIKWNRFTEQNLVEIYKFITQDHKIFLRMQIDSPIPGFTFKPEEHEILREEIEAKYFPKPKNWKEVLNLMFSMK